MSANLAKILKLWPRRWVTTALVVLVILYLTLVPRPLPDTDIEIPGIDKLIHFIMFGGLAFVGYIDGARSDGKNFVALSRRVSIGVVVAVVVFGGMIEVAQQLMGIGRSGDVIDFITDTFGAVCGVLLAKKVVLTCQKQKQNTSFNAKI